MRAIRKALCLLLAVLTVTSCAAALGDEEDLCTPTAQALVRMVPQPGYGTPGGEWTVFGLARWGGALPDGYLEGYLSRLEEAVRQSEGVLHSRKYTEYSRVVKMCIRDSGTRGRLKASRWSVCAPISASFPTPFCSRPFCPRCPLLSMRPAVPASRRKATAARWSV